MSDILSYLKQVAKGLRRPDELRVEIWLSESVPLEKDVAGVSFTPEDLDAEPFNPDSLRILIMHPSVYYRLVAQGILTSAWPPVYDPARAAQSEEYRKRWARRLALSYHLRA